MLHLHPSHSRREFLQVGAAGALGLSLPGLLRAQEAGLADGDNDISVILLFLWGGPPQQDMFDLKPKAPDGIRGLYQPIATRTPGIQICELLPQLAQTSDLYTIVRSATHNDTEHPRAAHYMMTGNQIIRGQQYPNMGASVACFAQRQNPIGSVVIGPRLVDSPITPNGQDGGFLGNIYAPFRVADALAPPEKIAVMTPPASVTDERAARRQRLFGTVEDFQRHVESSDTAAFDAAYQRAFALATSSAARQAFDLSQEADALRDRYGRYSFGQGALMARRLVESGVRFVQVNWREHPINDNGFDNHGDNFNKLKNIQAPQVDQTLSALLADLRDRGRLDKTLVLVTGEFGRTPKINAAAGRDHWPFVFSYVIAGAGIPGGRVIGASDQFAAYPAHTPVSPENTIASVFKLVGLDLEQLHKHKVIEESEGIPGLFG
ncbi:MAG: DUF1501 domain-containing protein [Pirellulales bacterium]